MRRFNSRYCSAGARSTKISRSVWVWVSPCSPRRRAPHSGSPTPCQSTLCTGGQGEESGGRAFPRHRDSHCWIQRTDWRQGSGCLHHPRRGRREREKGVLPMMPQIYIALAQCRPLPRSMVKGDILHMKICPF